MKRPFLYAVLGAVLSLSLGLALDEKELETKMKAIGDHMGGLKKAMAAKDMAAVADHAKGVTDNLKGTGKFWKDRGADDGVKFTKDASIASKALAKAAKDNNADEVKASMSAMGAACKGCHEAHRTKSPEGKYGIK